MELREYIDILYNRKWIVVGTLAIVLAVTLIVTFLQAPSYQSTVKILTEVSSASESVLGNLLPPSLSDTDRFIQNQVKIIQTDELAQAVQRRLEYNYEKLSREKKTANNLYSSNSIPKAAKLVDMVSVQSGTNNSIFDIVITGGDPLLVRDISQAYAEEYIANRQLAAVQQISEARKEVWNRILEVEDQIQSVSDQIKQYKPGKSLPTCRPRPSRYRTSGPPCTRNT